MVQIFRKLFMCCVACAEMEITNKHIQPYVYLVTRKPQVRLMKIVWKRRHSFLHRGMRNKIEKPKLERFFVCSSVDFLKLDIKESAKKLNCTIKI